MKNRITSGNISEKQFGKVTNKKGMVNRRVSVDLITGREAVYIYFDPRVVVDGPVMSEEFIAQNLYMPATIVKDDESTGLISVRLKSGDVFKVPRAKSVKVSPQDEDGVEDILRLQEFSEKSLLHTLRVRYLRDEIYTFAGPILISINPYKWTKDLYSDDTILRYHNQNQVILCAFDYT